MRDIYDSFLTPYIADYRLPDSPWPLMGSASLVGGNEERRNVIFGTWEEVQSTDTYLLRDRSSNYHLRIMRV